MSFLAIHFSFFAVPFSRELIQIFVYSIVDIIWSKKNCPVKEMRDFRASHRTKLAKINRRGDVQVSKD